MRNKRLLAILIVFVVLGGLAAVGGTAFVVRSLDITFLNAVEYVNEEQSLVDMRAATSFIMGKNILFDVDRARITKEIEQADVRIRVTNIEAKFPNKIVVKVRERYPVFYYTQSGKTVVMDANLRIVTTQIPVGRFLINISDQIDVLSLKEAKVGDYLTEFLEEEDREVIKCETLKSLTPLFANRENHEDSMVHLFTKMEFTSLRGELDLKLYLRDASDEQTSKIQIEIQDITTRFDEKLTYVWHVMEKECNSFPGLYTVDVNPLNDKIRVISPEGFGS